MKPLLILAIVLLSCGNKESHKQNPATRITDSLNKKADANCLVTQFPRWGDTGDADTLQVQVLYSAMTKKYIVQIIGFVWYTPMSEDRGYPLYWSQKGWDLYIKAAKGDDVLRRNYFKDAFEWDMHKAETFASPCVANEVGVQINEALEWRTENWGKILVAQKEQERISDSLNKIDQTYKPVN